MANTIDGAFVWYDHMTKDAKAAIAFYTEVVGWTTQAFSDDYTMWVASQGPLGGMVGNAEDSPPAWMGSVQVADVDASAKLTTKLGGKILHEPTDIPTVGRFAVIADPQGAVIALFSPKGEMSAHDVKEGEFCWNELVTSDPEAAFEFYEEVFGWKILDEMDMGPAGKYRIFGLGEKRIGGMMKKPAGAPTPPAWIYYVETSELDAALERATKRGAKVIHGPVEVPTGGRFAQLTDPQGVGFALHQGAAKS